MGVAYANEPAQALVPIWLFCNVYVVADNDVTIAGRARAATRRFHWLQRKTICIISNSAWSATRVLQDFYNSSILVLLQLCRALKPWNLVSCQIICEHWLTLRSIYHALQCAATTRIIITDNLHTAVYTQVTQLHAHHQHAEQWSSHRTIRFRSEILIQCIFSFQLDDCIMVNTVQCLQFVVRYC